MDTGKINQIIDSKNQDLERQALGRAHEIIEAIAQLQTKIAKAQEQIAEHRKQLTALDIPQIDIKTILGE